MDLLLWAVIFVLATSFLSNVSPFVGASYTLLATLQLNIIGFSPVNYLVVVVVSAIGATLAKVVIYFGAFGLKEILLKNKNVRLIGRSASSDRFYLVLFVTAILPVFPLDDFIYIGAGATSATLGVMTLVTFVAKVLKSGVEIALEVTILGDLSRVLGIHRLDLTLALTGVFVVIGIVVYKIDWEGLYRRVRRQDHVSGAGAQGKPAAKPL